MVELINGCLDEQGSMSLLGDRIWHKDATGFIKETQSVSSPKELLHVCIVSLYSSTTAYILLASISPHMAQEQPQRVNAICRSLD
jgi:hypothetical protein